MLTRIICGPNIEAGKGQIHRKKHYRLRHTCHLLKAMLHKIIGIETTLNAKNMKIFPICKLKFITISQWPKPFPRLNDKIKWRDYRECKP